MFRKKIKVVSSGKNLKPRRKHRPVMILGKKNSRKFLYILFFFFNFKNKKNKIKNNIPIKGEG